MLMEQMVVMGLYSIVEQKEYNQRGVWSGSRTRCSQGLACSQGAACSHKAEWECPQEVRWPGGRGGKKLNMVTEQSVII